MSLKKDCILITSSPITAVSFIIVRNANVIAPDAIDFPLIGATVSALYCASVQPLIINTSLIVSATFALSGSPNVYFKSSTVPLKQQSKRAIIFTPGFNPLRTTLFNSSSKMQVPRETASIGIISSSRPSVSSEFKSAVQVPCPLNIKNTVSPDFALFKSVFKPSRIFCFVGLSAVSSFNNLISVKLYLAFNKSCTFFVSLMHPNNSFAVPT